nr:reverse transcriptase domain-containing protein [Tanacetum cinerariifolium]
DDKLPVIITKDFSVEEKTALITVIKSHKRAIAWKLSDIKGIDPKFCTHKILMEEDFEPTVQHQRRVNPKIHDVIKQEVLKLLDAGLIYLISDSPWVSPVHYVPKKGGFTVIENEDNELILTRLVTGWLICIDYQKLNEATRKDHFPLPFMDQMLERLAGNQRKPHSPAHTERLLIAACLLGYAIHQARFRERMLKRCEDTNLCLNWEKSHFMVKEVNTENNDNTYQEQEPITDPDSPITPPVYTYNPNSEEGEEATISSLRNSEDRFDDTPVREIENLSLLFFKHHSHASIRFSIFRLVGKRPGDRIICDLNKTPDLFQEPPQNCPKCGNLVDGQYCQGCALLRKKFKEDLFTYCIENGIFQDFQDTSEPSNDNTNVVNASQEPFVVKQDPTKSSTNQPPLLLRVW